MSADDKRACLRAWEAEVAADPSQDRQHSHTWARTPLFLAAAYETQAAAFDKEIRDGAGDEWRERAATIVLAALLARGIAA
jgi:hypothetical protein